MKYQGMISLGTPEADSLGFVFDRFESYSYLWAINGAIIISIIGTINQGKGDLKLLFKNILASGMSVHVPTPSFRMLEILKKNGFRFSVVNDPKMGPVEVWIKDCC